MMKDNLMFNSLNKLKSGRFRVPNKYKILRNRQILMTESANNPRNMNLLSFNKSFGKGTKKPKKKTLI